MVNYTEIEKSVAKVMIISLQAKWKALKHFGTLGSSGERSHPKYKIEIELCIV